MASCPFRRASTHVAPSTAAVLKRSLTAARQSSVQIPNEELSALQDLEEEQDRNTLNLKHLSAAILLLTSPPNDAVQTALFSLLVKERDAEDIFDRHGCLKKLPSDVTVCSNYAYLEDIYDLVAQESDADAKKNPLKIRLRIDIKQLHRMRRARL